MRRLIWWVADCLQDAFAQAFVVIALVSVGFTVFWLLT